MIRLFRIFIWCFIIVTGLIAGYSLFVMDSTVKSLLQPVNVDSEEHYLPEDISAKEIEIGIGKKDVIYGLFAPIENSEFIVMIAHDGIGNMYERMDLLRLLQSLNMSVFLFDYRGYGLSIAEMPSEEEMIEDVTKAYHRFKKFIPGHGVPVFYGQGVGASLLASVIKNRGCQLFIAENPIPSLSEVVKGKIKKILVRHQFDFKSQISLLKCSELLIIVNEMHPLINPNTFEEIVNESKKNQQKKRNIRIQLCTIEGASFNPPAGTHPIELMSCWKNFMKPSMISERDQFKSAGNQNGEHLISDEADF